MPNPTPAQPEPTARRRIAVVSSSRADYGHLYWVLRALEERPEVDLRIVATGAHLSPGFGHTVEAFEADGFTLEAAPECLLDSDSDVGMAKTIGVGVLSLADLFGRLRPDLLLLIADRYEMLAPAAVALALRIPIAHIEGGDVSEGAIDDAVRNALTKMAHLHFVPTATARRRVLAMGEADWRVHVSGAPSLDHLVRSTLPDRAGLEQRLALPLDPAPLVVAMHPVTLAADETADARALLEALEPVDRPIVFCYPNADAGYARIVAATRDFCGDRPDRRLVTNLAHLDYWALLTHAAALLGNSSSGIMETPSLALPCVNIGMRQEKRERAANIIDCPGEAASIRAAIQHALDPAFRAGLAGMSNPYGDGTAGALIAQVLAETPIDDRLRIKRALDLADGDRPAFIQ
ncbi:UDP-N-acetylglucosamine 2-epimerase (hydrolyzing) [Wenzhouxiangella sp. XN79A]|uniref:UDP-N-acetylglucosamine 2-epimerase n=1 Tax=Wenzhouxiangella sp. XN79A TaxID=2724193 RepID=UPI00144AE419|nr:UDP-N-acetylglucosamine 2-epimerase [Wenzhouxiangella sp. XN79A]NKI36517.1 UDP-N-acetylglucosamine 2-epimerase (hydrolyzing) [Wenzhouxiangella sp. XN79A]